MILLCNQDEFVLEFVVGLSARTERSTVSCSGYARTHSTGLQNSSLGQLRSLWLSKRSPKLNALPQRAFQLRMSSAV